MKLLELMKEKKVCIERYIFCTPEKKKGNKREPNWEVRAEVACYYYKGVKIEFSNLLNDKELHFSDQKSFRDFVSGLNEVVALLDSNIEYDTR